MRNGFNNYEEEEEEDNWAFINNNDSNDLNECERDDATAPSMTLTTAATGTSTEEDVPHHQKDRSEDVWIHV